MSIDLRLAREETPGCEHVLHFNNAGAALMPSPVLDAVLGHLNLEAQIGGYEAAEKAQDKIQSVYNSAAKLVNCEPDELAIVENATRAWDMAFYSIPFKPGDRILTSISEYASNYIAFLQVAQRTGAAIDVVPDDKCGRVSIEALRGMIDDRVKLIAITHVPTNGGLVNPAEAVGRIAREAGVLYLLDACQSVGQMPVNVQEIGCHMMSATGRKFLRGPRGTGFLFVRRDLIPLLEPPFLDLHAARWVRSDQYEIRSDARRFENWESNIAGRIGLGAAMDYAMQWGLEDIRQRVWTLAAELRTRLEGLPGVIVRDLGDPKCGIVSFTVDNQTPQQVRMSLARHCMNVSVSPADFTLLDMSRRGLDAVVRASVHYYNSEEEVDRFVETLSSLP